MTASKSICETSWPDTLRLIGVLGWVVNIGALLLGGYQLDYAWLLALGVPIVPLGAVLGIAEFAAALVFVTMQLVG